MSPQGFVTVPDGPYNDACVKTWEDGLARSEKIGFPVMIKASEGGGGKGIRMVHDGSTFKNSFQAVAAEVPGASCVFFSCLFSPLLTASSLFPPAQVRPSSLWPSPVPPDTWRSSSSPISTETPSRSSDETAPSSDDTRRSSRRLPSPSPDLSDSRRWRRPLSDSPSWSDTSVPVPSSVSLPPTDPTRASVDADSEVPHLLQTSTPTRTTHSSSSSSTLVCRSSTPRPRWSLVSTSLPPSSRSPWVSPSRASGTSESSTVSTPTASTPSVRLHY